MRSIKLKGMTSLIVMIGCSILLTDSAWADVIVSDTATTRWGVGVADTPVGVFFNFIGDVVAFPFHFIGGLF